MNLDNFPNDFRNQFILIIQSIQNQRTHIENVHPAGVVSSSYLSDMFPVTELKKVVLPLPAKALKIAVNMKQVDKPTIAQILMHLCPVTVETKPLFSIFPNFL